MQMEHTPQMKSDCRYEKIGKQRQPLTYGVLLSMTRYSIGLLFLIAVVYVWSPIIGDRLWAAEPLSKPEWQQVQEAFRNLQFQKVLDILAEFSEEERELSAVHRLEILSLALLGKTAESLDAYEHGVTQASREDEPLLRELCIAVILPLRADMREQMRGAAYTALKEIGSEDIILFMEEGLNDKSGMVRALAAESLARLESGRKSQRFRQALEDNAGLVRATVLTGLGRTGDQAARTLIRPFLKDEQAVVQVAAAGAMIKLGHPEYWERVKKSALEDEGYERGAAYQVLGELGDARAIEILQQGLQDQQPSIRAAAVSSLGKLHMSEALQPLMTALTEKSPAVRSVAAVSLGNLKAEKAIPALTDMLEDANPGVRVAAVASLLKLSTPFSVVSPTVRVLMQDRNPGIRSGVAKALENGYGRDVVGTLFLLLNDPVPKPKIMAARSLGRIGDRDILPRLKLVLREQDEAVRATVAAAIVRILADPNKL